MKITLGIAINMVSNSSIGDEGMYGSSKVYKEEDLDAAMELWGPEKINSSRITMTPFPGHNFPAMSH